MKTISQLRFIAKDASANLDNEQAALFHSVFMVDETLDRLRNDSVYFVVGEKGTGKTAYAQYLARWGHNGLQARSIGLNADDYPHVIEFCTNSRFSYSDYHIVWQTAILLLLHDYLCSVDNDTVLRPPNVLRCQSALRRHALGTDIRNLDDALSLLADPHDLASALHEAVGSGFTDSEGVTSGAPVKRVFLFIREALIYSLRNMRLRDKMLLFLDGIDVRRPDLQYTDFLRCVRSLTAAVWQINTERLSRLHDPRPRIVSLIRPEILYRVGLQNLHSKMHDNAILLDWYTTYRDWRNSKLFRLADNMLGLQQDGADRLFPGDAWRHYVQYQINRRSTTVDHADRREPFLGFLRNSFYRPRDMVTLLTLMRDLYVGAGKGDQEFFDEDVTQWGRGRELYSEYLLGEILESLALYHEPEDYRLLRRFFGYLAEHADRDTHEFDYKQFLDAYSHMERYLSDNLIEKSEVFATADKLLQFLFELNIIGYRTQGFKDGYMLTKFCCSERSYSNIKPEVRTHGTYRVHYGVARALAPERMR